MIENVEKELKQQEFLYNFIILLEKVEVEMESEEIEKEALLDMKEETDMSADNYIQFLRFDKFLLFYIPEENIYYI